MLNRWPFVTAGAFICVSPVLYLKDQEAAALKLETAPSLAQRLYTKPPHKRIQTRLLSSCWHCAKVSDAPLIVHCHTTSTWKAECKKTKTKKKQHDVKTWWLSLGKWKKKWRKKGFVSLLRAIIPALMYRNREVKAGSGGSPRTSARNKNKNRSNHHYFFLFKIV